MRDIDFTIPNILLQTLRDCSYTTRFGLVDKGNPHKLQQLAVMNLVEQKNGGYRVNADGWAYLSSHKRDLLRL